jgi:transposase
MGKSITDLSSVTTVGLDLAKHVFQVHGVDASGRVVVAKAIRRNKLLEFFASLPRCLVGLEATIQDMSSFAGPREFAAYLGLTPKQNSSGGKQKLGRISKMGNRYLRKLLVVGAHAVLFHRKPHTDPLRM